MSSTVSRIKEKSSNFTKFTKKNKYTSPRVGIGTVDPPKIPPKAATPPPPPKDDGKPAGKIEGGYWVWNNGLKTHLRFIAEGIKRHQALPKGFYKEAEKITHLALMVRKAKGMGLKDTAV